MADVLDVWVTTNFLLLATRLAAMTGRVFAFSGRVTRLEAVMRAAFEFLSAYLSATNVWEPTLLILKSLLTAHAPFLHKKRAFGASFVVLVAVVRNNWVSTCFRSGTWIPTRRSYCATWQRGL
jgi:hypothetical protein